MSRNAARPHNYAGSTTAFTAVITDHGSAVRITQELFDDARWRRRDGCRRRRVARRGPALMTWLTADSTNEVQMVSRSHGWLARCRPIFGDGSSAS